MIHYILGRIKSSFVVLFVVSIITFVVLMVLPGNPAQLILGTEATKEALESLNNAMGLNQPLYEQYLKWFLNFIKFDFGISYVYGKPVTELILSGIPVTLSISLFSIFITFIMSFTLGIISAIKKNSGIDYFSRIIIQMGTAIPSFWIGMIFVVYFGLNLKVLPTSGFIYPSEDFIGFIKSITLPSIVLSIGDIGWLLRIVRSSMLESLNQDYMDMAKIKGLNMQKIYIKYALKGALLLPISVMGMQFAKLVGGTVVIETIFGLSGIGRLVLIAVERRDIVLLQGLVMFITTLVILITLIVDILIMFVNPKIISVHRSE